MESIRFLPLLLLTAGCAARGAAPKPVTAEQRGIYLQGMEGGRFRFCQDSTGFGQSVAIQAGAEEPTPRPVGGRSTYQGWTYRAYYVRWMLRDLRDVPQPDSVLGIRSSPQLAVTKILEWRAPRPGECGWREGELPDPAP